MLTYRDAAKNIDIFVLFEYHKSYGKIGIVSIYNFGQNKYVLDIAKDSTIEAFRKKSDLDGDLINIGFMVFESQIFDYIESDKIIFEKEPTNQLVKERQLVAHLHKEYRQCMDILRENSNLKKLWNSGNAPWKVWDK